MSWGLRLGNNYWKFSLARVVVLFLPCSASPFLSHKANILLVSTKNHNISSSGWFQFGGQPFKSDLCMHDSDQKDHSLWGKEWGKTLFILHCIQIAKEAMIWRGIKSPYLISSNSPSGGIKLIARSVSNLLSLTHCKQTRKALKTFSPLPMFTNNKIQVQELTNNFKD